MCATIVPIEPPTKSGLDLIREIEKCEVPHGELAIWWLGQISFVVKAGKEIIYLDPYLTPNPRRRVPPLLAPEEITHAGLIAGSHDHADHIDRPVWPRLAAASPKAKLLVSSLLRESLSRELKIPLDRFIGIDDGASASWHGLRLTGVASAHEFLDQDPATGRYPHMGFVVEANGCIFYHPGDTCVYEGLQTKLQRWKLDLMFLPINGRDAERLARGCIGNMTYQEAVDLAGALHPRLVIPAHYEMFANNSGDPNAFVAYAKVKYPSLHTQVCRHGELVRLARP